MAIINDGYITGALRARLGRCPICDTPKVRVIDIARVDLPNFGVEATILWDRRLPPEARKPHVAIGLECNCYPKFHRQVAHIADSRMYAGHAL